MAMNKVYELLERKGLVTEPRILEQSQRWSTADATELDAELDQALREQKNLDAAGQDSAVAGEFRFVASASFSGASSCDEIGCRVSRIQSLTRYAALYCDEVIVPIRVESSLAHSNGIASSNTLAGTLLSLRELRPLVDAGIVKLVPRSLYLCPHCAEHLTSKLSRTLAAVQTLIKRATQSFTVYRRALPKGVPGMLFEINGPDDFLEHGQRFVLTRDIPTWAAQIPTSTAKRKIKLSTKIVTKTGLIDRVFSRLISEAAMQRVYGDYYRAKYLTNLRGDAAVIASMDGTEDNHTANALLLKLTHRVPMFERVDIHDILAIRAQKTQAFIQYRLALATTIREYTNKKNRVNAKQADEIYLDVLAPAVSRLRATYDEGRRSSRARALKSLFYAGALVSLGLYGSHLPAGLAILLETLTGTRMLEGFDGLATQDKKESAQLKTDNFYFLLQLANAPH